MGKLCSLGLLETKVYKGEEFGLKCAKITLLPSASAFVGSDVIIGASLKEMQKLNEFSTISMFLLKDDLEKIYQESLRAMQGDSQSVKNIKNILL